MSPVKVEGSDLRPQKLSLHRECPVGRASSEGPEPVPCAEGGGRGTQQAPSLGAPMSSCPPKQSLTQTWGGRSICPRQKQNTLEAFLYLEDRAVGLAPGVPGYNS